MLRITLRALALLAVTLGGAYFARADESPCWTYYDPPEGQCGGGCGGYYPTTECWVGCTSGICYSNGNSADCCGTPHDYAEGYDDGGQTDCKDLYCGENPTRQAHIRKLRGNSVNASLRSDLGAFSSARVARMLFVPNRCTHAYDVVLENFPARPNKKGL
jgi:hypothetical protein